MMSARENRQANRVSGRSAMPGWSAQRAGTASAAITGGFLMALVLSACTAAPPALIEPDTAAPTGSSTSAGLATTGTTEPTATEPTSGAPAGAPASASPGAERPVTAAAKQTVTDALGKLAAVTPKPSTAQVTDALTGAGIDPAALEVSASRTPTGLEADAIEAAVLQGEDCVVGHIRDGNVTVTILPVLATGKCFVGSGT